MFLQYRPIRLTQCCTQFKSLGVKVLCVFHLHDNIAFTFKWYGNTWTNRFIPKGFELGTTLSQPNRSIMERTHLKAEIFVCVSVELCKRILFLFILLFISVYWKYFECLVQIFAVHRFAGILSDFRCTFTHVVFLQVTCSTKMLEKETLSFFRFCSGYLLTIATSEKSTKILKISDLFKTTKFSWITLWKEH